MKTAADLAGLVGRFIRMERDATPDEIERGMPTTIGMEALVTCVRDDGDSVTVDSDYGYSFRMPREELEIGLWRFHVWIDEEHRRKSRV